MTPDIVREAFNGNVAPRWIFLQGAKDDRVQVASKTPLARWIFDYGTGPVRLLFAKNRENFFESWIAMRKPVRFASGKYFVEQHTERIDIGRLGHGLAPGLLGRSRNGR